MKNSLIGLNLKSNTKMKPQAFFNNKNVKFHHRRDYGISVGVGVDNGNGYVAVASVNRTGPLEPITYIDKNNIVCTKPYDGDSFNKQVSRSIIIGRLNHARSETREQAFAVKVGPISDPLSAIQAIAYVLNKELKGATQDSMTRKMFTDSLTSVFMDELEPL